MALWRIYRQIRVYAAFSVIFLFGGSFVYLKCKQGRAKALPCFLLRSGGLRVCDYADCKIGFQHQCAAVTHIFAVVAVTAGYMQICGKQKIGIQQIK